MKNLKELEIHFIAASNYMQYLNTTLKDNKIDFIPEEEINNLMDITWKHLSKINNLIHHYVDNKEYYIREYKLNLILD